MPGRGGGARGQNLEHLVIVVKFYMEVNILTTSQEEAGSQVHALGGARGQ